MEQSATTLIIIATAAFVLPLLAGPLRVPAVVLEILFGILIGPSVANVVQQAEFLDQLAELGFFLLMFLSGFAIDLGTFERHGLAQIATGLILFGLTLLSAYIAARLLGHGVFLMFVLATTSVALVVPTLRSTRRSTTPLGQAVLISALLADFLTLLGVAVFVLVEEEGAGIDLLAIPAFFVIVALALFVLRRAAWWHPERFQRLFDTEDPEELGIRATLALMLVFVGISIVFGIEAILGAFLAGTVFAFVFRHRGALEQQLSGFSYGFLIPIFFINVGIRFDLDALTKPDAVTETLALIGLAILVKLLPAFVLLARRLAVREVMAAGALLSARLSLIIAIAEIGVNLDLIDRGLEASIIILAVVTTMASPTVFRFLAPPLSAREEPGDGQ